MKQINTLIIDIQHLLTQRGWVTDGLAEELSRSVAARLKEQFEPRPVKKTLRLSRMGPQCPCALWYSIHHPELEEPLPPWAEFKYSFGHTIEAKAIAFAKAAGHLVTGEQDAVSVDGIVGHRDCVVDGCIVDVKSCNSRSFQKYKTGLASTMDEWGYLSQLDGYLLGSRNDPLVQVKDTGYLLLIDKSLGHMHLHTHKLREEHIHERISKYKDIVVRDTPPPCECRTELIGGSGNTGLAYPSTYNNFKYCCFPNLRTFLYAGKAPVYLTKVVRKPDVLEIDKFGKVVYNG
jgi:hypothetical protein